ncbi:hypothetical protein DL96DRAFT_1685689 [Flagelloscypha sp. PMI_526]|nr:hypothetical protein DL96DRAFT_1685689 [Flagelloscypha sp. PMI_526]
MVSALRSPLLSTSTIPTKSHLPARAETRSCPLLCLEITRLSFSTASRRFLVCSVLWFSRLPSSFLLSLLSRHEPHNFCIVLPVLHAPTPLPASNAPIINLTRERPCVYLCASYPDTAWLQTSKSDFTNRQNSPSRPHSIRFHLRPARLLNSRHTSYGELIPSQLYQARGIHRLLSIPSLLILQKPTPHVLGTTFTILLMYFDVKSGVSSYAHTSTAFTCSPQSNTVKCPNCAESIGISALPNDGFAAELDLSDAWDNSPSVGDHISTLTDEVTRVSLEVGTEGRLGGQAQVDGVQGEWSRLADHAFASGDLKKRIEVVMKGEMVELRETVNGMTESLSIFTDKATRMAKEIGTEGKLGGQPDVQGVSRMWKELTTNYRKSLDGSSAVQFDEESQLFMEFVLLATFGPSQELKDLFFNAKLYPLYKVHLAKCIPLVHTVS